MNKGLSKVFLGSWPFFIVAMMLDGTASQDLSDSLYTLTGLIWVMAGTWLTIRILTDKNN